MTTEQYAELVEIMNRSAWYIKKASEILAKHLPEPPKMIARPRFCSDCKQVLVEINEIYCSLCWDARKRS